ncbi:hypothetical protein BD410DRAFT_774379 [Rickenella mellea]|uniref:Hemerythrin-like domain-containing protein n=1 Tax=Rickenella mellea TaxID=50990 RepID=A0A4Y7PUB0_9AGAM|nr:hypothetical protein BD410DRAFT_774379 [Rickenella mellea]
MYEYFEYYNKASGNADEQERWANQLIWEVARHAVGEEIIVYPLMEKHLGERGKQLADEDRADHQYVKEHLYKLEGMKAGTPEYSSLLNEIMEHLHKHNDSEEQNDLPPLEKEIGGAASHEAAASFKRTKKFVPTRPHPSAPDQPPFETLVGFLAAPIDKLRDVFTKFPTEEMKEAHK